ncbi:MAG: LysM peptidoglycan-binding domain-containing protein [Cyanobacteria bacterium SZAS-4]|nr:LysM peptidoglycan-binding domain-containing protein [Cyanobacteria bacterium SZAS-4]
MSRHAATAEKPVTAEQVSKDISAFKPDSTGEGLSRLTQEISDLRRSDPRHFQDNLKKLSENDNLTKLGFPSGFQLVGMEGGKLTAVNASEKGNGEVVRLDPRTGKAEAPIAQKVTEQQYGTHGRKYKVDETGGAAYHVGDKGAENIWNIARDYATGKNGGHKPTNAEVLNSVKELQDYNKIKNINLIHPGDVIKLPPGFDGKTWQGPLPAEKKEEPYKAPPVAAEAVIKKGVTDNIITGANADQPLTDTATGDLIKTARTPGVPSDQIKEIAAATIVKGDTDTDNMTKAWTALNNATPEQKKVLTELGLFDSKGNVDMTTSMFMSAMNGDMDKKFTDNPANKDLMDALNYMKTNWGLKFHMAGSDHLDQAKFNRLMEEMKVNRGQLQMLQKDG